MEYMYYIYIHMYIYIYIYMYVYIYSSKFDSRRNIVTANYHIWRILPITSTSSYFLLPGTVFKLTFFYILPFIFYFYWLHKDFDNQFWHYHQFPGQVLFCIGPYWLTEKTFIYFFPNFRGNLFQLLKGNFI